MFGVVNVQMVMAVFAYIYHQSFVARQSISIEMLMDQVSNISTLIVGSKDKNTWYFLAVV